MLVLSIIAGYVVVGMYGARFNYDKREEMLSHVSGRRRDEFVPPEIMAFFGLLFWPIIFLAYGFGWWVRGSERKVQRKHRKEIAKREAAEEQRRAEKKRLDGLCEPWNLMLNDPRATKEQKDFAREMLRGLVLDAK